MNNSVKSFHNLILYLRTKFLYFISLNLIVIGLFYYVFQSLSEEFTAVSKVRSLVSQNFIEEDSKIINEAVIFEEFVSSSLDKTLVSNIVEKNLNSIYPNRNNYEDVLKISSSLQQEIFKETKLRFSGTGVNIGLTFNDAKTLEIIIDLLIKDLIIFTKNQIKLKLIYHQEKFKMDLSLVQEMIDYIAENKNTYLTDEFNENYLNLVKEKNSIIKKQLEIENFFNNFEQFEPVKYTNLDNKIISNKLNYFVIIPITLLFLNFILIFLFLSFKIYFTELRK